MTYSHNSQNMAYAVSAPERITEKPQREESSMKTRLEELAKMLLDAGELSEVYFVAGELEKMAQQVSECLTEGEEQLQLAREEEELTEEAMDSMERRYWEGYTEALGIFSVVEENQN